MAILVTINTAMQHRARGVGYRAHPDAGQLAEIGRLID
jgi:hypothetical protein